MWADWRFHFAQSVLFLGEISVYRENRDISRWSEGGVLARRALDEPPKIRVTVMSRSHSFILSPQHHQKGGEGETEYKEMLLDR